MFLATNNFSVMIWYCSSMYYTIVAYHTLSYTNFFYNLFNGEKSIGTQLFLMRNHCCAGNKNDKNLLSKPAVMRWD